MSWENKKDTVIYYKITNYCNVGTDKLECSGYYRLIKHVDLDNETKL